MLQELSNHFRNAETFFGKFCVILVGWVVVGVGAYWLVPHRFGDADWLFVLKRLVAFALLIAEGIFLCILSDRLKEKWMPFAPKFALSLGNIPLIFRPIVALWWAAHFLLAAFIAVMIEVVSATQRDQTILTILVQTVVFFVISFTLAFGFNLYAMLTLTAIHARERTVNIAWRWRLLLDLAIAGIAAYIVRLHWL
jgi:hypothetical protein